MTIQELTLISLIILPIYSVVSFILLRVAYKQGEVEVISKYRNLVHRLLKGFRRGVGLNIVMTFACNLSCSYCGLKLPNGEYPKEQKRATIDQWKKFIDIFPLKIKDVAVSGGEPTLYPDAIESINWLIDKGYIVSVYTNLTSDNVFKLKPSIRLKLLATYHREYGKKYEWLERFNRVKKDYKINGFEIGENEFAEHRLTWLTEKSIRIPQQNRLHIGPDLQIFNSCFDKMNHYKKDTLKSWE